MIMEKIKKALSLVVAMIFLCQNISFGIQERSFALRPPSHFSQATEKFIRSQNEGGLRQAANYSSTPIEELVAREGKRIIFSLPTKPAERYQLLIQEDFVTRGIFRDPDEKPKYMLIETTLSDKKGMVYPVGILTGINVDDDGIMNLGWTIVLDYPSILEKIKKFRDEQCRKGTSLLAAMVIYSTLGPKTEYRHQMKFLYGYFTSKLNIETDE